MQQGNETTPALETANLSKPAKPPRKRNPRPKKQKPDVNAAVVAPAPALASNEPMPSVATTTSHQGQGISGITSTNEPPTLATKPKPARKPRNRNKKPQTTEASVQSQPQGQTQQDVHQQRPITPKPNDPFAMLLGPHDPSTLTESKLTLHYESQQSTPTPILGNQQEQKKIFYPNIYTSTLPPFSGSGVKQAQAQPTFGSLTPNTPTSTSVQPRPMGIQLPPFGSIDPRERELRQYGQKQQLNASSNSVNFKPSASAGHEVMRKFDQLAASISPVAGPSSSPSAHVPSNFIPMPQQIQNTLPRTVPQEFVKPYPLLYTQKPLPGFGAFKPAWRGKAEPDPQDPPIKSSKDLTSYEMDCLLKMRSQREENSGKKTSTDTKGSDYMTPSEIKELTKYRAGRDKVLLGGVASKKKKAAPNLILYPKKEPQIQYLIPIPQNQPLAAVSTAQAQTSERQQITPSAPPAFNFHSGGHAQVVQAQQLQPRLSTYEETLTTLRPTLPTATANQPPVRPTVIQPNLTYSAISTENVSSKFSPTVFLSHSPYPIPSTIPGPSTPQPQPQKQTSLNSIDSIISKVVSEGPSFTPSGNVRTVEPSPITSSNTPNLPLENININMEQKKEAKPKGKDRKKKTVDPPVPVPIGTTQPSSESPVKLTKKGLPRKPRAPKAQAKAEKMDTKIATASSSSITGTTTSPQGVVKSGVANQIQQQHSDLPQDLSLSINPRSLPGSGIATVPSNSGSSVPFLSLNEYLGTGFGSSNQNFGLPSFLPSNPAPGQNVNTYPTASATVTLPTHEEMKLFSPGMFSMPVQSSSTQGQGLNMQVQVQKMRSPEGNIARQIQNPNPGPSGSMVPQYNQQQVMDYVARFGQLSVGSFATPTPIQENKTVTTAQQQKKSKPRERKKSPTKKIETSNSKSFTFTSPSNMPMDLSSSPSPEKSRIGLGQNIGKPTTINQSPPMDLASVFPVKPLQKGTARIPKLTVAKNKNLSLVGGKGRTTSQMERMMAAAGLRKLQSMPPPAPIWPTLKTPSSRDLSPSSSSSCSSIVIPGIYPKKYERKSTPNSQTPKASTSSAIQKPPVQNVAPAAPARTPTLYPSDPKFRALLKNMELKTVGMTPKTKSTGSTKKGNSKNDQSKNKSSHLTPEDEQELKKGYGHNWVYTEEERDFLYGEGQYLIKRSDIGKKKDLIDVWRIEEGFTQLKRYRPQPDFNRVFHVGMDTFVEIKRDINLYRHFQPIYVMICIETKTLQVIHYFQDDRFFQYLMFLRHKESLYDDYFHLLQILICQVMDRTVIQVACLNTPGDKLWKKCWNANEVLLNRMSNEIRKYPRWNQSVLNIIEYWPRMTMCTTNVDRTRHCDSCIGGVRVACKRIEFGGAPYDPTTFTVLDNIPEGPPTSIQFCSSCMGLLRRWARIVHARNDIFICVKERVLLFIRAAPPDTKLDASNIRDYMLNDPIWVRRMFLDYLIVLVEAQKSIEVLQRDRIAAASSAPK